MANKEKTFEEKEIRRLKRSIYDLRRENKRLKNALKHNNLYVEAGATLERKTVQKTEKKVKPVYNKEEFLANIKAQREVDKTWNINKEEDPS